VNKDSHARYLGAPQTLPSLSYLMVELLLLVDLLALVGLSGMVFSMTRRQRERAGFAVINKAETTCRG